MTTLKLDNFHVTDVFTLLTLRRGYDEIFLPKLDTTYVNGCASRGADQLPITAFVKMAMSRSPSASGASGVAPLREVFLSTRDDPTVLWADLNAVLEQWSYKTDMPQIRCDRYADACSYRTGMD